MNKLAKTIDIKIPEGETIKLPYTIIDGKAFALPKNYRIYWEESGTGNSSHEIEAYDRYCICYPDLPEPDRTKDWQIFTCSAIGSEKFALNIKSYQFDGFTTKEKLKVCARYAMNVTFLMAKGKLISVPTKIRILTNYDTDEMLNIYIDQFTDEIISIEEVMNNDKQN